MWNFNWKKDPPNEKGYKLAAITMKLLRIHWFVCKILADNLGFSYFCDNQL